MARPGRRIRILGLESPLLWLPGTRPDAPKRNLLLVLGYLLLALFLYGVFRTTWG